MCSARRTVAISSGSRGALVAAPRGWNPGEVPRSRVPWASRARPCGCGVPSSPCRHATTRAALSRTPPRPPRRGRVRSRWVVAAGGRRDHGRDARSTAAIVRPMDEPRRSPMDGQRAKLAARRFDRATTIPPAASQSRRHRRSWRPHLRVGRCRRSDARAPRRPPSFPTAGRPSSASGGRWRSSRRWFWSRRQPTPTPQARCWPSSPTSGSSSPSWARRSPPGCATTAAVGGVVTGLLVVALAIACPVSGHHAIRLWWFAELGILTSMLAVSGSRSNAPGADPSAGPARRPGRGSIRSARWHLRRTAVPCRRRRRRPASRRCDGRVRSPSAATRMPLTLASLDVTRKTCGLPSTHRTARPIAASSISGSYQAKRRSSWSSRHRRRTRP